MRSQTLWRTVVGLMRLGACSLRFAGFSVRGSFFVTLCGGVCVCLRKGMGALVAGLQGERAMVIHSFTA